jgi:antitoxin HigA-1
MIVGFRDRETERIWRGAFSRALPRDIQSTALRKLRMLNNAKVLQDLAVPPNNQLEALKGNRAGSTASASIASGASASSGQPEVPIVLKSSTTTSQIPNPTPGEVLLLEFIEPMGLTQNGLARAIGVPPRRINEIVLGKRSVTADTDLRLARYFGVSEGFWLGLQADHDLLQRRREIDADLARIAPYRRAA